MNEWMNMMMMTMCVAEKCENRENWDCYSNLWRKGITHTIPNPNNEEEEEDPNNCIVGIFSDDFQFHTPPINVTEPASIYAPNPSLSL